MTIRTNEDDDSALYNIYIYIGGEQKKKKINERERKGKKKNRNDLCIRTSDIEMMSFIRYSSKVRFELKNGNREKKNSFVSHCNNDENKQTIDRQCVE